MSWSCIGINTTKITTDHLPSIDPRGELVLQDFSISQRAFVFSMIFMVGCLIYYSACYASYDTLTSNQAWWGIAWGGFAITLLAISGTFRYLASQKINELIEKPYESR